MGSLHQVVVIQVERKQFSSRLSGRLATGLPDKLAAPGARGPVEMARLALVGLVGAGGARLLDADRKEIIVLDRQGRGGRAIRGILLACRWRELRRSDRRGGV